MNDTGQESPDPIRFTSDPADLAEARRAAERAAERAGLDATAAAEVGLCVNEAVANIIRHAYDGEKDKPIELAVEPGQGTLTVRLRDWGSGELPDPHAAHTRDPLMPGGLGLMCLQKMMDEVHFHPAEPGMRLVMVRRRAGRTPVDAEGAELCLGGQGEHCKTCGRGRAPASPEPASPQPASRMGPR